MKTKIGIISALLCLLATLGFATITANLTVTDPNNVLGEGGSFKFDQTNTTFFVADDGGTYVHFHAGPVWIHPFVNQDNLTVGTGTYLISSAFEPRSFNVISDSGFTVISGTLTLSRFVRNAGGTITSIAGSFTLVTTTGTVTGTFSYVDNGSGSGSGGGNGGGSGGGSGGSGGGGGGTGGGSGSGGAGTGGGYPNPGPPPGDGPLANPLAPTIVVNLVDFDEAAIPALGPDSGAVINLTTDANDTFNAPAVLNAWSEPEGLTFNFAPASIPNGRGASRLTVTARQTAMPGRYTVFARAAGRDVESVTHFPVILVCDPPQILAKNQPAAAQVDRGGIARLTVTPQGSGPFTYTWYNGHTGSKAFPLSTSSDPNFTTGSINDTTEYWVRVTNACGSVDSQTAVVTVRNTPTTPPRPTANH